MDKDALQKNWQEAQQIEDKFWDATNVKHLMENCIEKIDFLKSCGYEFLASVFDQKEILEIGVGPLALGVPSFYRRKEKIKRLIKIDPLRRKPCTALPTAKKGIWAKQFFEWLHCLSQEGEYIQLSAEAMDYKEEFDTIILHNVLDHMKDPALSLQNSYNALRSGGVIIADVTCRSITGFIKFKYLRRYARRKSWDIKAHPYTFLQNSVTRMMEKAGFRNVSCQGGHNIVTRFIGPHRRPTFLGYK